MGLTAAGKRLVEAIHGLKMILDVGGHTGDQTSLDAIGLAPEVPVMCSHTNVAAIADNPRCISDRLIDAIARTGGVIGLTAVNDFHVRGRNQLDVAHSPRVGLDAHVDQMDYLKKRVGVDHIGIGPDFIEDRNIDFDAYNRTTSINRAIISDGPWLYLQGFENISELPNVERAMARRGWSQTDIDKVLGGNWLRLY
jgi:membrane dipeptidase